MFIVKFSWFSTTAISLWVFLKNIPRSYVCINVSFAFKTYVQFFENYQGVRNVSFSEDFVYLLNEWFLNGISTGFKEFSGH